MCELHSIAEMTMAAESGRRGELLVQHAAIGEDDTLRRLVVYAS